jgi:carbon monoxide dehydrogenase subunit G
MSMLKERIEIKKPIEEVWQYLDLRRWPKISPIFQHVEAQDEAMQVGARFLVTAGPGETKVQYHVEIVACDESLGRLVYKRTGGPLPGTSEWSLSKSANGTRVDYTNHYQHDLASPALSSISRAMIRFLDDLRQAIEK